MPEIQLSPYGKIADNYLQKIPGIDKYVIMPDHIHLILLKWDISEPESHGAMPTSPRPKSQTIFNTS